MPRFVELDVTDRAGWARVANHVGTVHILVNNAGVSVFGPDRRGELRRLRLDHGRELRRRGQRPRYFRPAHQGAGPGRAHRERRLDGGVSLGAAGRHLHREQVRRARPDRVPALQPRALRHRRVADVSGADPDQCLGLGVEASRRVCGLGVRPARSRRARAVRHRVRGRHGSARGRPKDCSPG